MTMYGVPPGSVATSRTRTTCSLRILIAARPSRRKRATSAGSCASSGKQKLDGDPLLELDVRRREHDAHAAPTELALDAVLVREDIVWRPE